MGIGEYGVPSPMFETLVLVRLAQRLRSGRAEWDVSIFDRNEEEKLDTFYNDTLNTAQLITNSRTLFN